jgi:hypothetical protein
MTDYVNKPPHYTSHPSGIECIQITRHMNFNRGNAMKYLWRAGEKGDAIEDLRKAVFYLRDEIARLEKEDNEPVGHHAGAAFSGFKLPGDPIVSWTATDSPEDWHED